MNIGLEISIAPAAAALRARSFAANSDVAYCGYVYGRYRKMLCITTHMPI